MEKVPLKFRTRDDSDRNFIFASWMRSFRTGSTWAKEIPAEIYSTRHSQLINDLLTNSGSVVACSSDDPDQIFGFGIYQPSTDNIAIVHWVYVKEMYRKLGIGEQIFRQCLISARHDFKMPVAVTHSTYNLEWATEKYNLVYNPYLAFGEQEHEDPRYSLC